LLTVAALPFCSSSLGSATRADQQRENDQNAERQTEATLCAFHYVLILQH
jgi:hypothetical protein